MSQDAEGMAGFGYLSDEPAPEAAAAADLCRSSSRRARPRPGRKRSGYHIETLSFALRMERRIRGRLQRLVKSQQEVPDLLQDVYLQLLIAGDRPSRTIQSTTAYVMTVVRNRAFDWLRHKKVAAGLFPGVAIDDCDTPAEGMRPDELASSEEELEALFAAINSLPKRCQQVFVMRKVYGMSHKAIAFTIKIAAHTVEQHMTRATYMLGHSLGQYDSNDTLIHAVRENVTRFRSARNAQTSR
ncbi:MAG: RNA polymerase sigma factor [Steroidobacteraceae bacterium]